MTDQPEAIKAAEKAAQEHIAAAEAAEKAEAEHAAKEAKDREAKAEAENDLADDLLRGAERIGKYIWGDGGQSAARRTYHLQKKLPVFRIAGSTLLYALKSKLREYIAAQAAQEQGQRADEVKKISAAGNPAAAPVTAATTATVESIRPIRQSRRRRKLENHIAA